MSKTVLRTQGTDDGLTHKYFVGEQDRPKKLLFHVVRCARQTEYYKYSAIMNTVHVPTVIQTYPWETHIVNAGTHTSTDEGL